MTKIEQVARAIWAHMPNCRGRTFEDHPMRDECFVLARAALAALEVPTPEMVGAGQMVTDEDATQIYTAMIRKAREG